MVVPPALTAVPTQIPNESDALHALPNVQSRRNENWHPPQLSIHEADVDLAFVLQVYVEGPVAGASRVQGLEVDLLIPGDGYLCYSKSILWF